MKTELKDEDLFKDSTMTFGEHLEELRGCIFRAGIGVVLGFLIGLALGPYVVEAIKRPITLALLEDIRQTQIDKVAAETGLDKNDSEQYAQITHIVDNLMDRGLSFRQIYVDPLQLGSQLQDIFPGVLDESALAAADEDISQRLVPLNLYSPLDDDRKAELLVLNPTEPFMVYVKAALVTGLLLSSPWVFYQVWAFIAAGLYPHEKKYVHRYLPISLGLFLTGALMAYLFVFAPVLSWLFGIARWLGLEPGIRISEWLGFFILLPVGFGLSFQLPLVMLFLERINIFDEAAYRTNWRMAILIIFVISMLLTPADPYSMLFMAVPLTFLYGGGILLCRYMPKPRDEYAEQYS